MPDLSPLLHAATARGDVPGVAGLLLDRTGTLWSGASGVRDTTTGDPMTLDTVFWIASMTKPLTAITAVQLVERGLLSLDAPVTAVLPQLAGLQVLDAGTDGEAVLRAPRSLPTLRQLLSHTSGYAYPRWDATLNRTVRRLGLEASPRDWDGLQRTPLVFDPGTGWSYGIGIDVVGKMIEAVTGGPLDEAVAAAVCDRLGMADTRFVLTDEQRSRAAPIHVRTGGRWLPQGPVAGRRLGFMAGGGGMFGTVPDYARLLAELLAGAPTLLSPDGWGTMTANQIGELQVQILRSADAGQSVDLDLSNGQPAKWSLGFMLNPADLPGRRRAGGQFWSGLANTYFWLDGQAGLAGVLMMSVLPFGHPAAFNLFEAFERAAYAGLGRTIGAE